jgi:cysteine desulfurase
MAIRCTLRDLGIKHADLISHRHHAVLHTLEEIEKEGKIRLSLVKVDSKGKVDLAHLEELLASGERSLVSLYACQQRAGQPASAEKGI